MPSSRHRSRSSSPEGNRRKHKRRHHSESPERKSDRDSRRRRSRSKSRDEDKDQRKHDKHTESSHRRNERRTDKSERDTGRDRHNERGQCHSSRHRDRDGDRDRDTYMNRPIKQEKRDDGYENQRNERARNDERRRQNKNRHRGNNPFDNSHEEQYEYGRPGQDNNNENDKDKNTERDKPNFGLSGKLTEDTNTFRGVVIKYNEPPEARIPKKKWRLYPFKGDEGLPILHLHRQSAYLLGRDRKVADIPIDHPSCSKQHAAFQFRLVDYKRDDGTQGRRVRPYIIDLESANGTFVNNKLIDSQRYFELFEKDVVKFGFSSREYVLMHDKVDTSELEDEISD